MVLTDREENPTGMKPQKLRGSLRNVSAHLKCCAL